MQRRRLVPGGIVSLASPNAFSEILEEGDTKVVLRDDYKGDFCKDKLAERAYEICRR